MSYSQNTLISANFDVELDLLVINNAPSFKYPTKALINEQKVAIIDVRIMDSVNVAYLRLKRTMTELELKKGEINMFRLKLNQAQNEIAYLQITKNSLSGIIDAQKNINALQLKQIELLQTELKTQKRKKIGNLFTGAGAGAILSLLLLSLN